MTTPATVLRDFGALFRSSLQGHRPLRRRILMTKTTPLCWLLLLFLAGTLSVGCRSFTGYPHGKRLSHGDQALLDTYFDSSTVAACLEKTEPEDAKVCRNTIVDGRLRAIDLSYIDFARSLNQESTGFNFGSDLAVLSLSGAGTIVTGPGTKVLAALSGIVTGAKSSIDKNVYYTKTLPALVLTMDALRSQKLTEIRKRQEEEVGTYSVNAALSDVDAYYSVGSIPAALADISAKAGAAKTKADEERKTNRD